MWGGRSLKTSLIQTSEDIDIIQKFEIEFGTILCSTPDWHSDFMADLWVKK